MMNQLQSLLTAKQVYESLGVSRTWLYLAERDGRYPSGFRLTSRCVRYRTDLHEQYIKGEWQAEAEL